MLQKRIIPCLQLVDGSLVKTKKFKDFDYIGDPINTVRIFNELEVDELCILDIRATKNKYQPKYNLLKEIANEAFMPMSYGGGIKTIAQAKQIFSIGFEKIVINSSYFYNKNLIKEIANHFGSQSIVVSIDLYTNFLKQTYAFVNSGTVKLKENYLDIIDTVQNLGAGEILINSINRDGTWKGFDIEKINLISNISNIPIIANCGAGNVDHINAVFSKTNASAVCLGSMVVYQKKDMGVLVNFPEKKKIKI